MFKKFRGSLVLNLGLVLVSGHFIEAKNGKEAVVSQTDNVVEAPISDVLRAGRTKIVLNKIVDLLAQANLELILACCDEKDAFDSKKYMELESAQMQKAALQIDVVLADWINSGATAIELSVIGRFLHFQILEVASFISQEPYYGPMVSLATKKYVILMLNDKYVKFIKALPDSFIDEFFLKKMQNQ